MNDEPKPKDPNKKRREKDEASYKPIPPDELPDVPPPPPHPPPSPKETEA